LEFNVPFYKSVVLVAQLASRLELFRRRRSTQRSKNTWHFEVSISFC